jgi:glycosyltransferase involved in cell wall biosynthesis
MTDTPNPPKKVLLLIPQLGFGGAERSLIRLANYLQQHADVTLVEFTALAEEQKATLRETFSLPSMNLDAGTPLPLLLRWMRRWWRLRKLKRTHDGCISFLMGANLLNALTGMCNKTIISQRGSYLYDANMLNHHPFLHQRFLIPLTLKLAARNVCINEGLRQIEAKHFGGTEAVAKSVTIPPFISTQTLIAQSQAPLPEKWLPLLQLPFIMTASRLSVEKNLHHLIHIYHAFCEQRTDVKCVIVGTGPQEKTLVALAESLGIPINNLEPNIPSLIFTGYQANPLPFMRAADVFAFTSGAEGLGNVLLEALAARCLIVATDGPWGARCVLQKTPKIGAEPYPTSKATCVDYGVLMPRADDPALREVWVDTLHHALNGGFDENDYPARAHERLADFAEDVIGPKWLDIIGMSALEEKALELS